MAWWLISDIVEFDQRKSDSYAGKNSFHALKRNSKPGRRPREGK